MSSSRAYEVKHYDQIPVPGWQRMRTDVFCTICSGIFALVMFIISIASFNQENLMKMTYPNDIEGNLCGWDAQDYKILYYTTYDDPNKRLCVSQCPKETDQQLKCFATPQLSCSKNSNPKYQVNIYDTQMVANRLGLFCMPKDEEQRKKVEQMSGLYNKNRFLSTYDSLWNSLWLGALFGVLYAALIQYFPKKVFNWTYLIGGIVFLITGILCIVMAQGSIIWRLTAGLLLIFIGIMVLYSIAKNESRQEIIVGGRLLQCATQALSDNKMVLAYIPIFMVLFFLLILLIAFQLLAVWSAGTLVFREDSPFYDVRAFTSSFFSFLTFIEFLWGMSFLKQSFNFCVSGYAIQWYYYKQNDKDLINVWKSLKLLLKYHWGSVVGGSLMLQFFYVPDLIGDYFWPTDVKKQNKLNNQLGNSTHLRKSNLGFSGETMRDPRKLRPCCQFLNLVRSQAMGYINIVSIPYCNASRYCELLSEDSNFYDRSQTTNRLFRISAHAILVGLATGIAFIMSKQHDGNNTIVGVVFCFMVALFSVTYFISLHSDISEGLLVSVFVEEKVNKRESISRPPRCVRQVYSDDIQDRIQDDGVVGFLL